MIYSVLSVYIGMRHDDLALIIDGIRGIAINALSLVLLLLAILIKPF